ncbi:MAG: DUF2764 family protein [Kiritimatiellia bacterium]|jgi:hypothetical protein
MSLPFLIASLPSLSMDAPPPLSVEAFREACAQALPASQAAVVDALLDGAPCDSSFVKAWRDVDAQIRNTVARKRAARRGVDAAPFLRPVEGFELTAMRAVEAAFDEPDPLLRERAIDRARLEALDRLQGPQPMTFEALLAYAVRLRIVTRWAACDPVKGDAFLQEISRLDGMPPPSF